jgi:hypothetical protein
MAVRAVRPSKTSSRVIGRLYFVVPAAT